MMSLILDNRTTGNFSLFLHEEVEDFEDFDAIDLLNVCAYASMSVSEYQLQSLLFTTHVATLNS